VAQSVHAAAAKSVVTSEAGKAYALRSAAMYMAGLGFLFLAKIKHGMQGYTSPKPFDLSETERAVSYDLQVVDQWLRHLKDYAPGVSIPGKAVLELGPGSDLGIGMYLLAQGAASYSACDVHNLVLHAPQAFYEQLLERIGQRLTGVDRSALLGHLDKVRRGAPSALDYVVRRDFDLVAAFGPKRFDVVFSQAAFEHFDDVDATVARLSEVCRPGATLVAEIDLKTHSRWIREHDPNNIYRYPQALYDAFRFRGIPNRWRPYQYQQTFERRGWQDVRVVPIERVAQPRHALGISKHYDGARNQLDYLGIVLCATWPGIEAAAGAPRTEGCHTR
jgi:SAM-dependent methyltransferase